MPSASTSRPPPRRSILQGDQGQGADPRDAENPVLARGGTAGKDVRVVSTGEPGAGPVTFRAAFTGELRTRRTQTGLLQREFAEKAHVSLSSYKKYEQGKKKPERKFATWCDSFYG